jgi:hypothetical protein
MEATETVESLIALARERVTEYAVMLIPNKGYGSDAAWVYTGTLPAVGDKITLEEFGGGGETVVAEVTAVERAHPFPIKASLLQR